MNLHLKLFNFNLLLGNKSCSHFLKIELSWWGRFSGGFCCFFVEFWVSGEIAFIVHYYLRQQMTLLDNSIEIMKASTSKRVSENFTSLRKLSNLYRNRRNTNAGAVALHHPAISFANTHSFSTSICAIGQIIEDVVQKVSVTIKHLEDQKYYKNLVKKYEQFTIAIENSMSPTVQEKGELSNTSDEGQPVRILSDQVCMKQSNLQRKSFNKRSKSNVSLFSVEKAIVKKIDFTPAVSPVKHAFENDNRLVPLEDASSHSDFNSLQIQNHYRQRCSRIDRLSLEKLVIPPNLLAARRGKNDKQQQYNFDYNGDRIPVNSGVVQKGGQLDVLKTTYRVYKQRQQDVKNPKKVLQKISFNRFPSILSRKSVQNPLQLYQLKSSIEKSFTQKGCRLSSIKAINQ